MNINKLTIGQAKELTAMFGTASKEQKPLPFAHEMIGKKVIIRTYSAGVWFGTLSQKSGKEVILTDARRMWRWWAAESISLSGVALYGVKEGKSIIAPPVPSQWLEAIEITPCTDVAIESIEGCEHAKAG